MEIDHYFDWAATSPPDMDIITQADKEAAEAWANPSSTHSAGKAAHALLEGARSRFARTLCVDPSTVYFTSGGTESDHIILLSQLSRAKRGSVLISAIEHPAVREEARLFARCGVKVDVIAPNRDGIITADAVMRMVTEDTSLVCVMAVNNETGAVCPIGEIARALHSRGGRHIHFHTDCVQAAGKVRLDIGEADSAAFSAHKISGPRGIGALYLAPSSAIEPFLRGGGQERGVRSGTENVAGALAFAACMERYTLGRGGEADKRYNEQCALTRKFIASLMSLPACRIISEARGVQAMNEISEAIPPLDEVSSAPKWSPWIVQAAFMGIPGQVMLRALDAMGFFISTGSACSSHKGGRPVLDAMGIPKDVSGCAVRFSFGHSTTPQGMDSLAAAIKDVVSRFR